MDVVRQSGVWTLNKKILDLDKRINKLEAIVKGQQKQTEEDEASAMKKAMLAFRRNG